MGPFRWIAVSGDPKDIHTIDDIILANFSRNHPIVPWIEKAREHVQFTQSLAHKQGASEEQASSTTLA